MNKKLILLVGLGGLMSVLLLSSSLTIVSAAPGDRGLDIVQEGTSYELRLVEAMDVDATKYIGSEIYPIIQSVRDVLDVNLTVMEVNDTLGRIDYRITQIGGQDNLYVLNTTELDIIVDYDDDDGDDLLEDFTFAPLDFEYVIAGTWENYTINRDEIVQDLDWVKGNVSSFDYTLNINDAAQKVTVVITYQMEETSLGWDTPYNESAIFDVREDFIVDYDDFVISQFHMITERTLNSIVNLTYLQENNKSIATSYYEEISLGPRSSGEEAGGIPGYELFTLIGLTVAAVFGLAFIVKHKRLI